MKRHYHWRRFIWAAAAIVSLACGSKGICGQTDYVQTNLVSDIPGEANVTDPNLVNPWGIAESPTSPFWISDNGTGVSTLYNGAGAKIPLTVTVPAPTGGTPPSAPTGVVFNSTTDFQVSGTPGSFIFDTEDGTISAWNSGTNAVLKVDNSASGAVYKGLALGNNGTGNFLYASNFNAGTVDVFNKNFAPTTLSGSFSDASLPAGYAPFDVQNINGDLFVTYAKQDAAKHDDVAGLGNGFIDEYDRNGNFIKRFASGGNLDSPWGLAVAPSGFGDDSGDLLVGNFGDGTIDAFNMSTGVFDGTLNGPSGNPIVIQGLWGLEFGNGVSGGNLDTLYFTAGIPGDGNVEDHGLFGSIDATVPDSASTLMLLGLASAALCAVQMGRRVFGSC